MLRIEYELRESGMTQTELAELANVNRVSISRIVRGEERAYQKRGERIAEAMGWEGDPAELFEPIEVV